MTKPTEDDPMPSNEKRPILGLVDTYANPIYEGDLFDLQEHQCEYCNHWIVCEVKKDNISACGYGLYEVKTGKYIANAAIANYPHGE